MKNQVKVKTSSVKRNRKTKRIIKIALLILLLLLLILYIVGRLIYNSGNFTITLDRDLYLKNNIIIYDDVNYKVFRTELFAETLDTFDNISGNWLPENLAEHEGGSHNGDNYLAYTFYIENMGENTVTYWSEIIIDEVIKQVDEAVRIRVYKNGIMTTYAKIGQNGEPELGTVPFAETTLVVRDSVNNFKPNDIDKYTIVMWLEGNDPECTDNILGGEIKMHMDFKSEFVEK